MSAGKIPVERIGNGGAKTPVGLWTAEFWRDQNTGCSSSLWNSCLVFHSKSALHAQYQASGV